MGKPIIPCPQRIRKINLSFGWLDHRFIRDAHILKLSSDEIALYAFLALVSNTEGVSYYGAEKICHYLGRMDLDCFLIARNHLIVNGLIGFRPYRRGDINGFYQVLSLDPLLKEQV